MSRYKSSQAGFTLVEAALVVAIGGIALAAAETALYGYQQDIKIQTTQNRLQKIDDALAHYLNVNGVLPCAADVTIPSDQPNFGTQVTAYQGTGPGSDCMGALPAPGIWSTTGIVPPAQTTPTNTATTAGNAAVTGSPLLPYGNGYIIIGAVPVRTLNLPDQYIADAWGNYFAYAVTDALTISNPALEYDQTQGAIVVQDGAGNDLAPVGATGPLHTPVSAASPGAQYVLVSYGPDGAGAYTLNGNKIGTACPSGAATPPIETTNCLAVSGAPPAPLTFIKAAQNSDQSSPNRYDDYVSYHTLTAVANLAPSGMITPMAGVTMCPPGWKDYNDSPITTTDLTTGATTTKYGSKPDAACTPAAGIICCQKD